MPKTTQFFVKIESGFDRWEETWSNQGRNLKKKKKLLEGSRNRHEKTQRSNSYLPYSTEF